MTTAGWCFMLISIGFVLSLVIFCYSRILMEQKPTDGLEAPLEIDTRDRKENVCPHPDCGHVNAFGERYCGRCGRALRK